MPEAVYININKIEAYMNTIAKKHIPLATSMTLSRAAKDYGDFIANEVSKKFKFITRKGNKGYAVSFKMAKLGLDTDSISSSAFAGQPANVDDGIKNMFAAVAVNSWAVAEQTNTTPTNRRAYKTKYLWKPLPDRATLHKEGISLQNSKPKPGRNTFYGRQGNANYLWYRTNKLNNPQKRKLYGNKYQIKPLFVREEYQEIKPVTNFIAKGMITIPGFLEKEFDMAFDFVIDKKL